MSNLGPKPDALELQANVVRAVDVLEAGKTAIGTGPSGGCCCQPGSWGASGLPGTEGFEYGVMARTGRPGWLAR